MPPDFTYPTSNELPYSNGKHTRPISGCRSRSRRSKLRIAITTACIRHRTSEAGSLPSQAAQSEMSTIMRRLDTLHSAEMRGFRVRRPKAFATPSSARFVSLLWLLLGAVCCVLLVACGNAANLLLARAAARSHEFGVRATLGAGRLRVIRQMLTESLLLAGIAGIAGILLAWLFLRLLLRLDPGNIPRLQQASLNAWVLLFSAAITLVDLPPLWHTACHCYLAHISQHLTEDRIGTRRRLHERAEGEIFHRWRGWAGRPSSRRCWTPPPQLSPRTC